MSGDTSSSIANEPAAPAPADAAEPAPTTLPATGSEFRRSLWVAASELIVDTGYSYRESFIVGQKVRSGAKWLEIPRVVLPVAASAGTATLALFGLDKFAVLFGFVGAIVIALEKHFDPIGQANAHTDKGDRLLTVYKDLRYFRNVRLRGPSANDQLERELTQIRKRADDLRLIEPRQVPPYAYSEARRQIHDKQSEYADDPLWQNPPDDLP